MLLLDGLFQVGAAGLLCVAECAGILGCIVVGTLPHVAAGWAVEGMLAVLPRHAGLCRPFVNIVPIPGRTLVFIVPTTHRMLCSILGVY